MSFFPVFLSVVCVLRDQATRHEQILTEITRTVSHLVCDYEIIIVDNASTDESIKSLKRLTGENGIPNLQVYALTKETDFDTAAWAGIENTLGDLVAVIDPLADDIHFLPHILARAMDGADVVFAHNKLKPKQGVTYRVAFRAFHGIYGWFNGIDLAKEAPAYRLFSKRVVNSIIQHPHPSLTYRHLPATGGFAKATLDYSAPPIGAPAKNLWDSFDRGMRLLVSTTRAPLRLVTAFSLFGAIVNILYSLYVVTIGLVKADVAPGWVSLSLQQSGMFFLLSLVLLVLGEYVLNMARISHDGPPYHVAQEFTSARVTRKEKINVEEVIPLFLDPLKRANTNISRS